MNNDFLHDLFEGGSVRIAIVGVFAILALFLFAETVSVAQDWGRPGNPATDTITVSANGQATMAPDVARITFSVQNTSVAVSDAQSKTSKQANDAIDFVKSQGIADKDVKALSYDISPQYSYTRCVTPQTAPSVVNGAMIPVPPCTESSVITGYQVSETVQVTVHDLSKVSDLLAGLGSRNVQNVSGPAFGLQDDTAGYDAARADAIEKAKAQADLLAKQLGVHLGKIVNFSESSGGYPYPVMAYGMGGADSTAKAPTPNVPTGENTYNASVSVTYEIR